jgi:GH15 family glucan-1,4-alpha-glucosidase
VKKQQFKKLLIQTRQVAQTTRVVETCLAMRPARFFASFAFLALLASTPAFASHLVTGDGFGFAVVSPENAAVTKFYAHPYSFGQPDAKNSLNEGVETANFIQQISWRGEHTSEPAQPASADYDQDSQIIRIRSSNGDGLVFMPFSLRQPTLIVSWNPASNKAGALNVEWSHPIASQKSVRIDNTAMQLLKFEGIQESLLLILLDTKRAEPTQPHQLLATNNSWALISIENEADLDQTANEFLHWRAGLSASDLAAREIAQLEQWRVKPAVHFASEAERHLWRQSEVMLRMAQSREPNRPGRNNNGLIVAALPDGVYFTPWVRDMSYALAAFIRMGHQAEARAGLLAYFNAQPTGKMRAQTAGAEYQVSVVRYFGDGSEEPFFTEEGATNIEFDDWGLALWALGQYEQKYNDPELLKVQTYRGPLFETAKDFIVKPLLANTEDYGPGKIVAADTSIWEEHQKDKKHFAWSTAMAIVGLKNFAAVAKMAGDESARTEALNQAALLQKGFNTAFIRGGKLHGTLEPGEKNDIDGALLAIINFGLVTDPALIANTVDRMSLLKVASGGYKRVRSNYTDPAIFEYWYEKEEFLFVDFSLAEVDRRMGRATEADAMFKRIVTKAAADHNIIPEMYVAVPCRLFPGKIGDPTGALPMVGYGAGEYILHLLDREAH